jgi:hypothetical protein
MVKPCKFNWFSGASYTQVNSMIITLLANMSARLIKKTSLQTRLYNCLYFVKNTLTYSHSLPLVSVEIYLLNAVEADFYYKNLLLICTNTLTY